ncbi:hypothetical protein A2773_06870 [Candidatus Gottesmanbacteria bacterium RIFCSPHIGHO2_01_FULL_39_10]|uniref:Peptidase S11 D-alanyl-D-alanine carboxypeptidase A N-terminal domain-containing protein n=1 Tax=Candidatus Gottesmanbacteria bacterium RIFCSPHIGHO2_01_FULL_39_10 TaxID=1798375 RepID=A0A1F5ZR33_9BACT|nr:MAG: hypothetical protein A2773_06870 [Candidatus Gottesmanbacteria bacterium RIFCSPHIGHO2_01_FULL_39_10]
MGGKISKILLIFIAFGLIGTIVYWGFNFSSTQAADILSPLPGEVAIPTPVSTFYEKVMKSNTSDNLPKTKYFPENLSISDTSFADIEASAYLAFDLTARKILLGKNITSRMPIASLTKIATAIVAIENANLSDELVVSLSAAKIGEATMGLTNGEIINVEEALYGLMLPSGNDAAETIAEGIGKYKLGTEQSAVDGGGGRAWFIEKMNEKVQALGLLDTYFYNPSGLDGDDEGNTNFSTALDIMALTNYALDNGHFAKIASTLEMEIPYKENYHKAFYLYNILRFDESYPGLKGVKPGNSIFARETLSSYYEKDGRRIIVVILGSDHTKDDVIKIYDKIFGVVRSY